MTVLFITAGLWFGTIWLFVAAMHARALQKSGVVLNRFWLVHLRTLVVLAFAGDVAFNFLFGTLMYAELPPLEWHEVRIFGRRLTLPVPELLFTSRCKRHKWDGAGWRNELAHWWCRNLNYMDAGHC